MRNLDEVKIQTPTCYELADFISNEGKRLGRRGMKWRYTLKHGPLLNFVLAWYSAQPATRREEIARTGAETLREILSKPYDEPNDDKGGGA